MDLLETSVVESIRVKVEEQIERTEHLIRLVPADSIAWNPDWTGDSLDVGHLLGHLLECLAGFCAVFSSAFPGRLEGVNELRSLPVNHLCRPAEALERIRRYATFIGNGFDLCRDTDLTRGFHTVFAASESMATLLLGNLEHLINHKYQLFVYLKMLGASVTTGDLYHWRGEDERKSPR